MTVQIAKTRYGCNLQGALLTLANIENVVPIIHGIPGLGLQGFGATLPGNGLSGELSGYAVPSTNMSEKHIIFGGGSRLREQIKNTVKIIDGSFFIVLSGVESEIISDDVIGMTREISEQGYAAACYKAAGFHGNARTGYQDIVDVLLDFVIEKYPTGKQAEKTVNLLGIVPEQDLYWQGNLREAERVLHNLGIKANRLVGAGQSLTNWFEVPDAEVNIVLSKWGLAAAEKLLATYGTPYIDAQNLGLGPDIDAFITEIGKKLRVEQEVIKTLLTKEREYFNFAVRQFAEYYFYYDLRRKIAVIGEENKVIRYSNFLRKYLGMEITAAVITDFNSGTEENTGYRFCEAEIENLYYSNDTSAIAEILQTHSPKLILGAESEREIAAELGVPLLVIGNPQNSFLDVYDNDIGYTGAVTLLKRLSAIKWD